MRIEQLVARAPKSRQPGDTLGEVAQVIRDHDCGCLLVAAGDGCQHVVGLTQQVSASRLQSSIQHDEVSTGWVASDREASDGDQIRQGTHDPAG